MVFRLTPTHPLQGVATACESIVIGYNGPGGINPGSPSRETRFAELPTPLWISARIRMVYMAPPREHPVETPRETSQAFGTSST